jgi:carbonic anhydrase
MSLIDEALSANATIANGFDPARGKPPALVLSTRLLGSQEIMIINHTDCGMLRFTDSDFENRLRKETGQAPIAPARFYSFTDAEANTKEQIQKARSHPWIAPEVPVRAFVYDVSTGRLSEVFPDQWRAETVAEHGRAM